MKTVRQYSLDSRVSLKGMLRTKGQLGPSIILLTVSYRSPPPPLKAFVLLSIPTEVQGQNVCFTDSTIIHPYLLENGFD